MRDRSFGPTVLVGLAGAGLTAVAGTRDWARASGDAAGIKVNAAVSGSDTAPLVAALALLALAAWGVVLVLRGRLRRVVAVVGAVASVGALVAVIVAFQTARSDALGALMGKATGENAASSLTVWYYAAGVGSVVATAAFLTAVWRSPRWPEMGTRYDAPAAQAEAPLAEEDLWRAMDRGHDPTS